MNALCDAIKTRVARMWCKEDLFSNVYVYGAPRKTYCILEMCYTNYLPKNHKIFGQGRVEKVVNVGKDCKLTINFGGQKREILSSFVEKI